MSKDPAMAERWPNAASEQAACDRWNELVPVGASVEVRRDDGRVERTKTASVAWVLGSGIAVVKLESVGPYALSRVRVTRENTQPDPNNPSTEPRL